MIGEMSTVPPGGAWKFFQRLPDGQMKQFTSNREDDLFQQVKDFRIQNGIDIGELEREIKLGISGPSHKVRLGDSRTLRERITGWKSNRQYQALEFVEQAEAERRAKICIDCPMRRENYADGCAECYVHVEQDLFAMRQGRTTSQDIWLGGCEVCGHDNKTAVHLAANNLLHRKNFEEQLKEKAPSCWLLTLDNEQPTEVE